MKRLLIYIIMCLALPITVFGQTHRYDLSFQLSKKDFCDTIPIEIIDNQVYVNAMMNGRQIRLNLDTGSSQGAVYSDFSAGVLTDLGGVISRDANQHMDSLRAVELPPFTIGSITVSHYVATLLPQPMVNRRYDACLGFDLLNSGVSAKIDSERKILILSDRRGAFEDERGFALKYKLKWFVPYVMISPFMRHVDQSLFDLGSRALYTMNKASFDTHSYKSKQVNAQVEGRAQGHLAIGTYGPEDEDEVAFLHLDRLKWADFSFLDYHTITTQGASRIGAEILRYGNIIINPHRRQIIFQPHNGADSVSVNNKQMGVAFVPVEGKATVGLIWDGCEAYKRGMRQGDRILRINTTAINTFADFVRFPFVKGRQYRFLLVSKEGNVKEVMTER